MTWATYEDCLSVAGGAGLFLKLFLFLLLPSFLSSHRGRSSIIQNLSFLITIPPTCPKFPSFRPPFSLEDVPPNGIHMFSLWGCCCSLKGVIGCLCILFSKSSCVAIRGGLCFTSSLTKGICCFFGKNKSSPQRPLAFLGPTNKDRKAMGSSLNWTMVQKQES